MPTATEKKRSGSRAPANPKTKPQRLTRVQELTERIDARQDEIDRLGEERKRIIGELRAEGVTFREIAASAGKSEQAIHKAFHKARRG